MPLRLSRSVTLPVEQRGKLMNAVEIAAHVFSGHVGRKWVLANVPREYRHRIGREVLYYENEVRLWIETTREAA